MKKDRTQPPTEVRYVPPVMKKTKQVPAKTIDIFEGMTVAELSKRTGKSITDLQSILINVGEKAYSMFDTLSIDVAELVAMVCVFICSGLLGSTVHGMENCIQTKSDMINYWIGYTDN